MTYIDWYDCPPPRHLAMMVCIERGEYSVSFSLSMSSLPASTTGLGSHVIRLGFTDWRDGDGAGALARQIQGGGRGIQAQRTRI